MHRPTKSVYITFKFTSFYLIYINFIVESSNLNTSNQRSCILTSKHKENYTNTTFEHVDLHNFVPLFLRDINLSSAVQNFIHSNSIYTDKLNTNGSHSSAEIDASVSVSPLPVVLNARQNILKKSVELSQSSFKSTLGNRKEIGSKLKLDIILELVRNLDTRFKNIRNIELGVKHIQQMFSTVNFTSTIQNDTEIVTKMSSRITSKVQKALNSINNLFNEFASQISQLQSTNTDSTKVNDHDDELYLSTVIQPCPLDDLSLERSYDKKQIEIVNYMKHRRLLQRNEEKNLNSTINTIIRNELMRLHKTENTFKHVYFLSRFDHASYYSCQYYFNDLHFRYLYVSHIKNKRKIHKCVTFKYQIAKKIVN